MPFSQHISRHPQPLPTEIISLVASAEETILFCSPWSHQQAQVTGEEASEEMEMEYVAHGWDKVCLSEIHVAEAPGWL